MTRFMLVALILLGTACGVDFQPNGPGSTSGVATADGTAGAGGAGTSGAGGVGASGGAPGGSDPGGDPGSGGSEECVGCAAAYSSSAYVPVTGVCGADKGTYTALRTCICSIGACATACSGFCSEMTGPGTACLDCVDDNANDACDGAGTDCGVAGF